MKRVIFLAAIVAMTMVSSANAQLTITGVIDGDLSGGNPKAVVLTATADIADLSIYGIGSANNGEGTDGEEFTLSESAMVGDQILIAANTASFDFFQSCFPSLTIFQSGAANINGDDAVELFRNGGVIDTYGDSNVNGDGETWDYTDGFAVRTGGTAGVFNQTNYDTQVGSLDGLDEAQQKELLDVAFGFTGCLLADVNRDGLIDFNDIPMFVTVLLGGIVQCEADCNEDGLVDFNDIPFFVEILLNP